MLNLRSECFNLFAYNFQLIFLENLNTLYIFIKQVLFLIRDFNSKNLF